MDQLAALAELATRYSGVELGRRLRTALGAELEELDDEQIGELAESLAGQLDGQRGRGGGSQDAPEPYYPDVQQFVEGWLLPVYRRSVRGHDRVWCPCWWEHAEALSRLVALWRAWELLRLDAGTGMSVWWRDHADHHLTILLSADGPFKGCEDGHSDRRLEQLPHEQPPAGAFRRDDRGLPAEPVVVSRGDSVAVRAGAASNGRQHTVRL